MFATLAMYRRRPTRLQSYAINAMKYYSASDAEPPFPQSPVDVPHDLLSRRERKVDPSCSCYRTDYSPGSEAQHVALLGQTGDCVQSQRDKVFDDAARYALPDTPNGRLYMFAFLHNALVPRQVCYAEDVPWEDSELQDALFPMRKSYLEFKGEADPDSFTERERACQVFIADSEALQSGKLRWVSVDEFGDVVYERRLGAEVLVDFIGLSEGLGFELGQLAQRFRTSPSPPRNGGPRAPRPGT